MKRLFWVHSPISELVCTLIIEQFEISKDDCVILLTRNHSLFQQDLQTINYPFTSVTEREDFAIGLRTNRAQSTIKLSDELVRSVLDAEDFLIYLPLTANAIQSVLVSMPECEGYYLYEEGTAAYNAEYLNKRWQNAHPSMKSRLIWMLYFRESRRMRYLGSYFFNFMHSKFRGAYHIGEDAFRRNIKNKRKLDLSGLKNAETPKKKSVFFALDGAVIERIPFEKYCEVVLSFISALFQKVKYEVVYIKSHPQYSFSFDLYQRLLESISSFFCDKESIYLANTVPSERFVIEHRCDVITSHSSLAIYAGLAGLNVYSYSERLSQKDESYKNLFETLPESLTKHLQFL